MFPIVVKVLVTYITYIIILIMMTFHVFRKLKEKKLPPKIHVFNNRMVYIHIRRLKFFVPDSPIFLNSFFDYPSIYYTYTIILLIMAIVDFKLSRTNIAVCAHMQQKGRRRVNISYAIFIE